MSRAQRGPLAAFAVLALASTTAIGSLMASTEAPDATAQHGEILIQARAQDGPSAPVSTGEHDLLGGVLPGEVTGTDEGAPERDSGAPADSSPRGRTAARNPGSEKSGVSTVRRGSGGGSGFTRSLKSDDSGDRGTNDSDRGGAVTQPPTPQGPPQSEKEDPRAGGKVGGGKKKPPPHVGHDPRGPKTAGPPGPGTVPAENGPHRGDLKPGKHGPSKHAWKSKRSQRGATHRGKPDHAKHRSQHPGKSAKKRGRGPR